MWKFLVTRDRLNIRVVGAAFAGFSALMLLAMALPRTDFVLVVGWPGMSEAEMMRIITDSGGSFVSGGTQSWLAVANAETKGLPARLMKAGAMLVLDHSLAAGCMEGK